jgi:hypothetical protein
MSSSILNPVIALRAAATVALLQWAAHTTLFLRAKPRHGSEEVAVVNAMKSHFFAFGGATRSYWDLYFGYGLIAAVIVLVEAALFWQLAGAATGARRIVRSIAVVFLGFNVVHALLAAKYFFVTPIVPDVLIALCLAAAIIGLRADSPMTAAAVATGDT